MACVLPHRERAGRRADDHRGAGSHGFRHRIDGIRMPGRVRVLGTPQVLADHDAHLRTAAIDHAGAVARREVPRFVEDVVVGEQALDVERFDAATTHDGHDVAGRYRRARCGHRHADEHRRISRATRMQFRRHLPGSALAVTEEALALQQVTRRIAAQRELRERDALGSGRRKFHGAVDHPPGISGDVSDHRVESGKRNPHGMRSL